MNQLILLCRYISVGKYMSITAALHYQLDTLKPIQMANILKMTFSNKFFNENFCILIQISLNQNLMLTKIYDAIWRH